MLFSRFLAKIKNVVVSPLTKTLISERTILRMKKIQNNFHGHETADKSHHFDINSTLIIRQILKINTINLNVIDERMKIICQKK